MRATFEARIARAGDLAKAYPSASEILKFYCELAAFQKPIFEDVQTRRETDVRYLLRYFPDLMAFVRRLGPEPLADFGDRHLESLAVQEQVLLSCWERAPFDDVTRETGQFFGRVLVQPFAEYLATRGDMQLPAAVQPVCPFCHARPAVAILNGEGEGAKRWLQCSLCGTEWPYRRVICPGCGEEDKDQLPVYIAPDFDHVRVDACDTCQTYVKSVDLTRNGLAVPVVDEIATVALNIWAEDRGYSKLEPNLLGM